MHLATFKPKPVLCPLDPDVDRKASLTGCIAQRISFHLVGGAHSARAIGEM